MKFSELKGTGTGQQELGGVWPLGNLIHLNIIVLWR